MIQPPTHPSFWSHFSRALGGALGIASWSTWLVLAAHVFRGDAVPSWPRLIAVALGVVCITGIGHLLVRRARSTAIVRVVAELFCVIAWLHATLGDTTHWSRHLIWIAVVLNLGIGFGRMTWRALEAKLGAAPWEPLRWAALIAGANVIMQPLYTKGPNGAGDAYWYVMMLSDFLQQTRAGVFPVWIGQSEYAFNGAVSPLHLAPGFQHAGWLLDLLTFRSLEYLALKNLLLVLAAMGAAFSAYFSFRAILPRYATLCATLALAYVWSPALLAPLAVGDQYMTFLAGAVLPIALYAMWRCFDRNDFLAHGLLGASVAALWLLHTPIALWASLFFAPAYLVKMLSHRRERREWLNLLLASATFIALGALPLCSAFALDNVLELPIVGQQVRDELAKVFPAVVLPLSDAGNSPSDYKPGYFALVAGVLSLLLFFFRPRRSTAVWIGCVAICAAITLPTPSISRFFWDHLPALVLKTTNTWAIQRLALIWASLMLFSFAASVAALGDSKAKRALIALCLTASLGGLVWSYREANRLSQHLQRSVAGPSGWQHLYVRHNLILTRYPYSSFQAAPTYFSHGYMDPMFETHLLSVEEKQPLPDNSAAVLQIGTKVAEGVFTGHSSGSRPFYNLKPDLTLEGGKHYLLKVFFSAPKKAGWFQILGPNLFREYILPDSGVGVAGQLGVPRGFGSLPSSSPYVSLFTDAPEQVPLQINFIEPDGQPAFPEIECARFELWEYDPTRLPIRIQTYLPYRGTIESTKPAFLESPRMWLSHYRARVNGKRVPVLRSPNNQCMIQLPAGISHVEIKYVPPTHVEIAYRVALVGWPITLAIGLALLFSAAYGPVVRMKNASGATAS